MRQDEERGQAHFVWSRLRMVAMLGSDGVCQSRGVVGRRELGLGTKIRCPSLWSQRRCGE